MQIGNSSLFYLLFFFSIKNILNYFNNPDVIIFHDIYNLRQVVLMFKLALKRKKIFITPRGAFSEVALNRSYLKKRLFLAIFLFPILKNIYGFIALNKNEKKQIRKIVKKKRIIIISNGINDNKEIYEKLQSNYELKQRNKCLNLGYLGRFDIHIKGLDILLEALLKFQLKYKSTQIILTLIGDHIEKNEFSSKKYIESIKSKLLYPDNLKIKGPYYSEKKWDELSKVDLLMQLSRTEGMPNSVLEAMSIGIPSCVTEFTNMGEIIRNADNGWVVELNSDSILKFFNEIIGVSKKEILVKGINGMKYAQKHLLWDTVCISDYS